MSESSESSESSDTSCSSSEEELQEAFAEGALKPGLNVAIEKVNTPQPKNEVNLMKQKLEEIKLDLPWIERLDMVNAPAPLAPELALQMQETEIRRAKQLKANKKMTQYEPHEDPVLNDFRRETMFHRQAQGAVMDGIARLRQLDVATSRPDDYFAEMVKSDDQMQKVRVYLVKKQAIILKSERMRQLRQHKAVAKRMQIETTLGKHTEKRELMEEVKKYRKGVRKDLDFLDDKNKQFGAKSTSKNIKYGHGGKKRNSKRNTKSSSAGVSTVRKFRPPRRDIKERGKQKKRLSKNPRKNAD